MFWQTRIRKKKLENGAMQKNFTSSHESITSTFLTFETWFEQEIFISILEKSKFAPTLQKLLFLKRFFYQKNRKQ